MILRKQEIRIELTPKDLASEFCDMDSKEMAEFFNAISEIVKDWDFDFNFQLQALSGEKCLTKDGRNVMSGIGEYAAPF